jgi:hypothetical protein
MAMEIQGRKWRKKWAEKAVSAPPRLYPSSMVSLNPIAGSIATSIHAFLHPLSSYRAHPPARITPRNH